MRKFFQKENGKSKKVLLVGLGILGGGTSMAKFVIDEGGELAVTDLRNEVLLKREIKAVKSYAEKQANQKVEVKFCLERHDVEMFKNSDVVLFNPAVPYFSTWPQYCLLNRIPFFNDFTLFQEYIEHTTPPNLPLKKGRNRTKQIWVTGTRGKSTTTTFVHHLLGKKAVIGGNVLGQGLQKISKKKANFFVLETSNFQLEYPIVNEKIKEPSVAVITNIFTDHINRHKTTEEYRRVKKQIFKYNKETQLFLNKDEESVKEIWEKREHVNVNFINHFGQDFTQLKNKYPKFSHNQIVSLATAICIARYFHISEADINKRIKTAQAPKMRQEVIFENKKFKIINDSTATNPDALIAAIKSYPNAYFISGGTDAELDFSDLTKLINKEKLVEKGQMVFLKGTGTDKILSELDINETEKIIFDDFDDCFEYFFSQIKEKSNNGEKIKEQAVIILSPGAKSFGLFKNEYDRGEKFNKFVKNFF